MDSFITIRFMESLEGFTISFPLNLRKVQTRKSKPLSMCVIAVFFSDSCRPRDCKKSLTRSFKSSAISFESAVMIKSFALMLEMAPPCGEPASVGNRFP